ncbi:MAG TPA: radical SAM protein [Acidobacteriota bacterium]|nr:radical SAM protein [Acidobacteriota bacterium]
MSESKGPVVLVMAPDGSEYKIDVLIGRMPTFGMYYVASSLEESGYPVVTLNRQWDPPNPLTLASEINSHQPSLIGFTLYDQTLPMAKSTLSLLRLAYKGPIVVGGYTPTFHAEDLLRQWPEIDYVVMREGEHAIVALMEHLEGKRPIEEVPNLVYRDNGEIRFNPEHSLVDVTKIPWPVREWPQQGDVTPIVTRRGCMSRCTFCSMVPFYDTSLGPIVRRREPSDVVDEIAHCVDQGATNFMVYDDDFGMSAKFDRQWCQDFLDEIRRRKVTFCWGIETRVADVIRGSALLPEMIELGLSHMSLGMESILPRQLKLYNKGYKQEHIFQALEIAESLSIDYQTNVIFWDPWITMDEAAEHLALMDQIKIQEQLGSANFPLFSNKLLPRKGTKVHDMLKEQNMLLTRPGSFCHFDFDFVDDRVQQFFNTVFSPFNVNIRSNDRPPAIWLHVPHLEYAGHKEQAARLRTWAREIAHVDYEYFHKLLHTGMEIEDLASQQAKDVFSEIHDEFAPRINECLSRAPSLELHAAETA